MKTNDELIRLKKVLLSDNIRIPNGMLTVLKNDISSVLQSYFCLNNADTQVLIEVDDNGVYDIKISAKAEGVKEIRII